MLLPPCDMCKHGYTRDNNIYHGMIGSVGNLLPQGSHLMLKVIRLAYEYPLR